jgi:thiol-disulfide isomerase/thioredoxin
MAYQVANVTEPDDQINSTHPGPPIAAPDAAGYARRDDGRYAAVVDIKGGTATIDFDPARLQRSQSESSVTVRSGNKETPRFAAFAQTMHRELNAYKRQRLELKRRGSSQDDVTAFVRHYDWSRLHEPIRAELRSDDSALFKQASMILYLGELGEVGEMTHSQLDPAVVKQVLKDVPPSSPLWSAVRGAFEAMTWANYHAKIDGYPSYFDRIIATNPDRKLREEILSYDLSVSYFAGDRERTARVYERLTADFPTSKAAASARKMLAANRKVLAGKPVPRFRIAAIGDDSTVYSNETLRGKVYLIDFWGVWCGPCLAEMPQLHQAYETYKEQGFTILSLSCDPSPEKVQEFRRGRWPMPWLNGFLANCYKNREQNQLVADFEVVGFPSGVLVGRDGTVLQTGPALRGERLNETLAKVFAAEKNQKKTKRS